MSYTDQVIEDQVPGLYALSSDGGFDVVASGSERVVVSAHGLQVDQPTTADWYIETGHQRPVMGDKWTAVGWLTLGDGDSLKVVHASTGRSAFSVATGPGSVTVAVRASDAFDIVNNKRVTDDGTPYEHDVRVYVQVPD